MIPLRKLKRLPISPVLVIIGSMKTLIEKAQEIEEQLYSEGMDVLEGLEKVDVDQENVEAYKLDDRYLVLLFDNGDTLCSVEVVENFEDILEIQ
jgi:hypothetical protein